jgi:molybdopterin converting factor small subunit
VTLKVYLPGLLTSYTQGVNSLELDVDDAGPTLAALLAELDRRYPGIRFRIVDEQDCIRRQIRIFVGATQVHELSAALGGSDEIMIVGALSGG